tara:strand:- start:208 stop:510 length:303 start_codon:yes stop_codon:yes gene_type:complete
MNITQLQHVIIALVIQLALGLLMGWWQAGALATAVFFAREYAQVEYRIRSKTGLSLTDMMPWHVLQPRWWTLDGLLDWITPAVCCAAVAQLMPVLLQRLG